MSLKKLKPLLIVGVIIYLAYNYLSNGWLKNTIASATNSLPSIGGGNVSTGTDTGSVLNQIPPSGTWDSYQPPIDWDTNAGNVIIC